MALIDAFLPEFRLRQIDRIAVAANPEQTWEAVRGFDINDVPLARQLFAVRTVPERLFHRGSAPTPAHARLEDIVRPGSGFILLGEESGKEFVVGSVGRFWELNIPWAHVTPATFTAFDEPGYGKLAWSLRVDPREWGGSWISFDLRVTATDEAAWQHFLPYWRLIGQFSHALRKGGLLYLRKKLGHVPSDRKLALPGDELIPDARGQRTHVQMIEAPPDRVWPWLVQMGCRRAGWYSIDKLDNAGVQSAEKIIPELQYLAEGNLIPATPTGTAAFAVLRLEPVRVLVLGSPELLPEQPPGTHPPPWLSTWAFALEPVGTHATRLIVRVRARHAAGLRSMVTTAGLLAAHEVMERAQLHNLKRRAESLVHARPAEGAMLHA